MNLCRSAIVGATMLALSASLAAGAWAKGGASTPPQQTVPQQADEKPVFLKEDNNDDLAYCHVVLSNDSSEHAGKALTLHRLRIFNIETWLGSRADKSWEDLAPTIVPWTEREIERDVEKRGVPRLSVKACSDLVDFTIRVKQ